MSSDPNRIEKYTGYQFSEIEIIEIVRAGRTCAAFLVSPTDVPIVFNRPGEFETPDKKKKVEFAKGTVYFRHGSKSEPGNRDDLSKWHMREIEKARKSWMTGIRKVVETAPGESLTLHHAAEMAPFFPQPMQDAGTSMHHAASRLAIALQDASVVQTFDSMRQVNGHCTKSRPGASAAIRHIVCANPE